MVVHGLELVKGMDNIVVYGLGLVQGMDFMVVYGLGLVEGLHGRIRPWVGSGNYV